MRGMSGEREGVGGAVEVKTVRRDETSSDRT